MTTDARLRPHRTQTVLDLLRTRIDPASFDAVVLALEVVAADLGYGDIRPRPGAVAWIDELRAQGEKIGVMFSGEGAQSAVELAGIPDRFDAVVCGPRNRTTYQRVEELDVEPTRAIAVDVVPAGIAAARAAGLKITLAVAGDGASAEALRASGADAVVADLQEMLGFVR